MRKLIVIINLLFISLSYSDTSFGLIQGVVTQKFLSKTKVSVMIKGKEQIIKRSLIQEKKVKPGQVVKINLKK